MSRVDVHFWRQFNLYPPDLTSYKPYTNSVLAPFFPALAEARQTSARVKNGIELRLLVLGYL
jgi:hypothetical protein